MWHYDAIRVGIYNATQKTITAFQVDVEGYDNFSDKVYSGSWKVDHSMPLPEVNTSRMDDIFISQGETTVGIGIYSQVGSSLSPFFEKATKVSIAITRVVYSDGSVEEINNPVSVWFEKDKY